MTFAKMVKNREWEKVFDILDQGTDCALRCSVGNGPWTHVRYLLFRAPWTFPSVQSIKDKLGVLTKEEFEESLKQNGFEESDLVTERKRFISSSRDLSGYPWASLDTTEYLWIPRGDSGMPDCKWITKSLEEFKKKFVSADGYRTEVVTRTEFVRRFSES